MVFAQKTVPARSIEHAIELANQGKNVSLTLYADTNAAFPEKVLSIPAERLTGLVIDNCSYTSFPKSMERFVNLEYFRYSWFYFSDCPNASIPDFVYSLKGLKYLQIEGITIDGVSPKIKSLNKLEKLGLYMCKLPDFPMDVLELDHLIHLNLSCNEFTAIPSSIDRLKHLKVLEFEGGACGGTPISVIPESIGNLSNLEHLSFGYTEQGIGELPKSFTRLKQLKSFECNGCGLKRFPENIGLLDKLENLSLINLKTFETFPSSFYNLSSVKSFRFYQYSQEVPMLIEQQAKLDNWGKQIQHYEYEIFKKPTGN